MRRLLPLVFSLLACASRERGDALGRTEQAAFKATGSMSIVRDGFGLAVLPGGSVIAAGGYSLTNSVGLTEIWDPTSGTWSKKRDLLTVRSPCSATVVPSGKVVVIGGSAATGETYDPSINEWTAIADDGRFSVHSTTLLPTGKILVVGAGDLVWRQPRLYDPTADSWSEAGTMTSPRENHAAHLMYDGRVAVLGGFNGTDRYLSTIEIYAPATNTWSDGGALRVERMGLASAILPDKRILLAGGYNSAALSSAEIYDPLTKTSVATSSMSKPRSAAKAFALSSGRVLVIGGDNGYEVSESSTEVYDPVTKAWSPGPNLTTPRDSYEAVALSGGRILIVAGQNGADTLSTAELFGGLSLGDACVIDEECTSGKCEASKCAPAPVADSGVDAAAPDTAVTDSEAPADTGTPAATDAGGETAKPAYDSGCGCRTTAPATDGRAALLLACAIAAFGRRRDNSSSGGRHTRR